MRGRMGRGKGNPAGWVSSVSEPCGVRSKASRVRMKQVPDVIPSPAHNFVNTTRGSSFSEICFHDLPLDFSLVKVDIHESSKLEDQEDVDGSKIIREVFPLEIGDTSLSWLKWEIGDISRFTTQTNEEKSRPRSAFDMQKYVEIQNDEQHLFENWREQNQLVQVVNCFVEIICRLVNISNAVILA
ncbi:hypothetical protein CTI12_AA544580 [Artemisia annua]|uniref:Uncharacterized protein n=1 Tax=Artemisia annua TaxID=35608 RepID=A0A2U1L128_ARTAN|nr:hypothetical protein CTI12_AA544580 [Artemisia annua]